VTETDELAEKAEAFIRSLKWHEDTPEDIRTLVVGNIRGFASFLSGPTPEERALSGLDHAVRIACQDALSPALRKADEAVKGSA
jgi:hypothetical protein